MSKIDPASSSCSVPSRTALPSPEITYSHCSLLACRLFGPPVDSPGPSTIVAACERLVPVSTLKPLDGSTCHSSIRVFSLLVPVRHDHRLDVAGIFPARLQRLLRVLQAVITRHDRVQVHLSGGRKFYGGRVRVGVAEGAREPDLTVLDERERDARLLAGTHPDHDGGAGGTDAADSVAQRRFVPGAFDQGVHLDAGFRQRLLGDVDGPGSACFLGQLQPLW